MRTRRAEGRKTLISPSSIRDSRKRRVQPISSAASGSERKIRRVDLGVDVSCNTDTLKTYWRVFVENLTA
jgi:hypothetical protein